jgi:PadR family transcriptional regulator PadR
VQQPLSYTATLVLQALARNHRYGFEIMRVSELPSGTVYPLLRRLEHAGLVRSRWEDLDPAEEGRPARRFYQLTPKGKRALEDGIARLAAQQRLFPDLAVDQKAGD